MHQPSTRSSRPTGARTHEAQAAASASKLEPHLERARDILASVASRGLCSPPQLRNSEIPHFPGADRMRLHPLGGIVFVAGEVASTERAETSGATFATVGMLTDNLLCGNPSGKCPVTILAERKHETLTEEYEEAKREETQRRLASGALAVLKFDKSYLELLKDPDFDRLDETSPPCPAFKQISAGCIVAFLLPSELFRYLSTPGVLECAASSKLLEVPERVQVSSVVKSIDSAVARLEIPNWRPELMAVLAQHHFAAAGSRVCFGLHAIRFPTAKDLETSWEYPVPKARGNA